MEVQPGVPTGDLLADNARLLTETRFRSASVGDESSIISEYLYRQLFPV